MTDCLIIGGGIIGLLTARELFSAGMSVTLIEQGKTGQESSWAGGGIVSPLYPWRYPDAVTALANWSQQHYPHLSEDLEEESRISPEYTTSGLLILEPGDEDAAMNWSPKSYQQLEQLDAAEITACEPSLRTESQKAIWMPQVAQVRNPRMVKAAQGAIQGSVDILENTPVERLTISDNQVTGVVTRTGTIKAKHVIVCAGAWTAKLLAAYGPTPEIEPVLGQMILFKGPPGAISRIVLHHDRYVIPRLDGRVLVGSTLEHRGFNKSITDEARKELQAYAVNHFPSLEKAELEHQWAGLRPSSPHGTPYISQVPGIEGLYVNAGHFRNGIVLGPASARLLSDMVLGRDPIIPPAPYALTATRS